MARAEISDEELVRHTRAGDPDAFGTLVRRYVRPGLAVAWEFAGNREDAEDLLQEAFLRALRRLDRFDPSRRFAPWFYTILRNLGRNLYATRGRWRWVPLAEDQAGGVGLDPAERREVRDRVDEGLDDLSDMQRACFRLCEMEGFSRAEAGEMLSISEATVRVHIHRARRTLQQRLAPLEDEARAR